MFPLFKRKVKQVPHVIADLVTWHQAYEGILVLGATGSGKTSGPGQEIALNLLADRDCGGLWLCAKPDEFSRVEAMCKRLGRTQDLVRWGPGSGSYFPFLEYELSRPGGGIMSAEAVMSDIVDATSQAGALGNSREPFWPLTAKRQLRHAIAAVWLAKGRCDVQDVYNVVNSQAATVQEFASDEWRNSSFCFECMSEAYEKHDGHPDLAMADDFFRSEWPRLGDKTSSSVRAHTMASLDPFMTAEVAPLVNNRGGTRINIPELVLAGKIVASDADVLTMREPGRLCNIAAKVTMQRGVLARPFTPGMRPVFLFADEANWFAVAGIDALAQSVARQSLFINVVMAQNIPLLQKSLGGDNARSDLEGWTANFQTKIFCQNSCPVTNEYASRLLGQSMQVTMGGGGGHKYDPVKDMLGQPQEGQSVSWHEHLMPTVRPEEFTRLRKGGPGNSYLVEAIVYRGGGSWTSAVFNQRI